MTTDRKYFKVEKGGFTETQIKAFIDKYQAVNQSWFEFADQYGSKKIYHRQTIEGIVIESGDIPNGWYRPKGAPQNCYRPRKRKECMADYNRFIKLERKPSGLDLSSMLNLGLVTQGMKIMFPGFEKIGDDFILSLPENGDIPDGVSPLKTSEYWQLKETTTDDEEQA